ncbi:MAG: DNA-primase RepB domain-containing protein [Acidiferrobacteraceae bacterium]
MTQRERGEFYARRWGVARNIRGENLYLRPARGWPWPLVLIDDLPNARAFAIARKYSSLVIETTLNNCQVWIATNPPINEQQRLAVQRCLCARVGSDPGSVSGEHWGRAPGFQNMKPGRRKFLVRVALATVGPSLVWTLIGICVLSKP